HRRRLRTGGYGGNGRKLRSRDRGCGAAQRNHEFVGAAAAPAERLLIRSFGEDRGAVPCQVGLQQVTVGGPGQVKGQTAFALNELDPLRQRRVGADGGQVLGGDAPLGRGRDGAAAAQPRQENAVTGGGRPGEPQRGQGTGAGEFGDEPGQGVGVVVRFQRRGQERFDHASGGQVQQPQVVGVDAHAHLPRVDDFDSGSRRRVFVEDQYVSSHHGGTGHLGRRVR